MSKNKDVKDFSIEAEGVFLDVRSALNFLIVDETEAIEGYDNVLRCNNITTEHRSILEEIRNEEIAHIVKLSNIYKELATGSIEPETLEELQGENVSDTNYIYETDKPNVKWRIHQSKTGSFYFKDPDGNIYKENGSEVRFGSKSSAGEFFIKKLFNKSLWGSEIPRVVVDSKTRLSDSEFNVGDIVMVSRYGSTWKDVIRRVLTREEAAWEFPNIINGTSNEIKQWYILKSGGAPVADFRISPVVKN